MNLFSLPLPYALSARYPLLSLNLFSDGLKNALHVNFTPFYAISQDWLWGAGYPDHVGLWHSESCIAHF
jgi:hypothetical protein